MSAETPRVRPQAGGDSVDDNRGGGVPLKAGVTVVLGDRDHAIGLGVATIGRSSQCAVRLDDPLISRQHAKLVVTDARVQIEDLQSANGVYVNGTRIYRPRQLFDGDRVLIGTHELSVFEYTASRQEEADRPTLDVLEPSEPDEGVPPSSKDDDLEADLGSSPTSSEATRRADAFMFVGRLADKMLSLGKHAEAERILFDHMTKVLHGARAGLPVPREVLDAAGAYAAKLARATRRGVWIDYAIELHTLVRVPVSASVADALCEAVGAVTSVDQALFSGYLELLRSIKDELGPSDLLVCNRLECLTLPPASKR